MSYFKNFKELESQLNSPSGIDRNNRFHLLDDEPTQPDGEGEPATLGALIEMLEEKVSLPNSSHPDTWAIIAEILKRLKKRNLTQLIKKLAMLESLKSPAIIQETYQTAVINKLNNSKDEDIFNPTAPHWVSFEPVIGDHGEKTFKPFAAYLLLRRRMQLIREKNPVFYLEVLVSRTTLPEDSIYKKIINKMAMEIVTQYAGTAANLPTISKTIFLPEIQRYAALSIDLQKALNHLSQVIWDIYSCTIGRVLHPLYLLSMATVDQVRNMTIWLTKKSLTTNPNFWPQFWKFSVTAAGSGTAVVGVVSALSDFKVPPGVSVGGATTAVLIAGAVNLRASADLKDRALSPITLNKIYEVCCAAAATSAILASHGIEKILLHFKYRDNLPPDAKLDGAEAVGGLVGGMGLAALNFFTSIRSGYGTTVRVVSDYFDPQSHLNQLIYGDNLTKKGATYLFMLITFTVVPYVYSVSATERLTNEKFSEAIKNNLAQTLAIFGTAFFFNLATANIFINRTIDWIYDMYEREQIQGTKEWLATIVGTFLIGGLYLLSNYGNGESNAQALWDNQYWSKSIGGLMALSVFPSVWITVKGIVKEIMKSHCFNPADLDGLNGEKRSLLPR